MSNVHLLELQAQGNGGQGAGVQEGMAALAKDGIKPGFLIIDDGWQTVDADVGLRPGDDKAEQLAYEAERQACPCPCHGLRRAQN